MNFSSTQRSKNSLSIAKFSFNGICIEIKVYLMEKFNSGNNFSQNKEPGIQNSSPSFLYWQPASYVITATSNWFTFCLIS